jgi:hypothetical protein
MSGTREIIENSPWNTFWGVGKDGQGENTMGRVWMLVRSEVQEEKSGKDKRDYEVKLEHVSGAELLPPRTQKNKEDDGTIEVNLKLH